MTDNEEKLENFLSDIQFDDMPDDSHRDRLEQDLLRTLANQPPRHPKSNVRRIIIQRRIAKLAAAAITIAVVFSIVHFLGGRVDGTSVAWAQVLANIEQMNWVHLTETSDPPFAKSRAHLWSCREPSIVVLVRNDGEISYCNYTEGVGYFYDTRLNRIIVSDVIDRYLRPSIQTPSELAKRAIQSTQKHEGEGLRSTRAKLDGKEVRVVETPNRRITLDAHSRLLLRCEGTVEDASLQKSRTFATVYDYPTQGPSSIYEAGAPQDAEVTDVRPTGEAFNIAEEIRRRYRQGYGDHIAMVLESYLEEDSGLSPRAVFMIRQKGRLFRQDEYSAYNYSDKCRPSLYDEVNDCWPDLTIARMLELERTEVPQSQVIYNGIYTIHSSRGHEGIINRLRGESSRERWAVSVNALTWFEEPISNWPQRSFAYIYQFLKSDEAHTGLIGLRITQLPIGSAKHMRLMLEKNGEYIPIDTPPLSLPFWSYWVDPAKDYMVMERTGEGGKMRVLKAQPTPEGIWYPSHILRECSFPGGRTTQEDMRISILTGVELSDEVFDPNYVFNVE